MKSPKKPLEPSEKEGQKEVPTFVYVAACEGRTKVGIARDCDLRMRQLSNGSGAKVTLVSCRLFGTRLSAAEVEERLHRKFSRARLHGEWFTTDPAKIVAALERAEDPDLHIPDWAPGMPPEIAQAGIYERWKWKKANQMTDLPTMVMIHGRREGRKLFLEQRPQPLEQKDTAAATSRRSARPHGFMIGETK